MIQSIFNFSIIILTILFLSSCGRHQHGYVVNDSNDTVTVEFEIRSSESQIQRNYFYDDIINQSRSSVNKFKLPGDLLVKVDTVNKIAILRFLPGDKMSLGTVRMDESRDDFKAWEFKKIKIYNNQNDTIIAENKGIMRLIEKRISFFSQDSHYMNVGFD